MSEKLCLQWNDFQDNVKSAFGNLKESTDFADVTLACEDGHQIEAHKVVLAASSPFFQAIFKRNKHSHPWIYMRGVKPNDLAAMVDFLYLGEANVFQENLDSFLAIAEELQLKGLKGSDNSSEISPYAKDAQIKPKQNYKRDKNLLLNTTAKEITKDHESSKKTTIVENQALALPTQMHFSGNLQDLAETVKSMMETSQNMVPNGKYRRTPGKICKVCRKEGHATDIINHIEANHLEGVSIPCNFCEKLFGSRNGLKSHVHRHHRQN